MHPEYRTIAKNSRITKICFKNKVNTIKDKDAKIIEIFIRIFQTHFLTIKLIIYNYKTKIMNKNLKDQAR